MYQGPESKCDPGMYWVIESKEMARGTPRDQVSKSNCPGPALCEQKICTQEPKRGGEPETVPRQGSEKARYKGGAPAIIKVSHTLSRPNPVPVPASTTAWINSQPTGKRVEALKVFIHENTQVQGKWATGYKLEGSRQTAMGWGTPK